MSRGRRATRCSRRGGLVDRPKGYLVQITIAAQTSRSRSLGIWATPR